MVLELSTSERFSTAFDSPSDIIEAMIELRIQLFEVEQQIQALQPAFFAACLAFNTDKIQHDRATISRRLTPAQWTYSSDILDQQALLKQLKHSFHQNHEPSSGRDITWIIKLLLVQAQTHSISSLS